jgi:hypothetical protein
MLAGVTNRVPSADHWSLFRQAEQTHPELIQPLIAEIQAYAADKQEFDSTTAGREILSRWSRWGDWSRTFPADGSKLFGMVMWVDDHAAVWHTANETVGGRSVRVYRRAPAPKA